MTEAARLSIPLLTAGRAPTGKAVLLAEGTIEGSAFDIRITEQEIHFAFAWADGPAFAIDMNALVREATNAIESTVFGQRRAML